MPFVNFLFKPKNELEKGGRAPRQEVSAVESEPTRICPGCRREISVSSLRDNFNTCECGYHFRMSARQRISMIADQDSFEEWFEDLISGDPLEFPGYSEKLDAARKACGEKEAVVCGKAKVGGYDCALFVMEPDFMMGSMGTAVGEKITRTFEQAAEESLHVIGFTVSGGARMQEGILSLMQMAKTSGAVRRHSDRGLLYVTVLTDPTTGGVTASFAMEGDVIMAEPGALVGFAGARVIEQTTRKKLPAGFQRAEFLLEHGFVDMIVPRKEQKEMLARLLRLHSGGGTHEYE